MIEKKTSPMNQQDKNRPFHKRAIIFLERSIIFLAGPLFGCVLISICVIGLWLIISLLPSKWAGFTGWLTESIRSIRESIEFLRGQEKETITFWIVGFMFSIWLISSPLICLYWLFKPAERFWWKHKYISYTIFYGSFFGCVGVIIAGIHSLLWFFPRVLTGFQIRLHLSVAIGIITAFALWLKLSDFLEQKRKKDREERIDWEYQQQKHKLLKGETMLAPFIEEIKNLENLEKEHKLSPFLEERLIALERVCDDLNVRWRQKGAPRVPNIHKNYDNPNDHSPNAYGYCGTEREDEELMNAIRNGPKDGVKDEKTNDPLIEAQKKELKNLLTKRLTRAERLILVLYYYEEMTIKEIAEKLDLSEARVSQMHSSIITRLKKQMKKGKSNFESTESSCQTENPYSNVKMFERFTERAQEVTMVANQEARRLNHEYIGTEHLLLALVQKAGALCRKIFNDFNITETNIRQETDKLVKSGTDLPIVDEGKLPYTPRAKNVIKYAVDEAQKLQRNYYVGTEHILLGLLRETDGIAYKVLTILGLELNKVRKKVLQLLGGSQE